MHERRGCETTGNFAAVKRAYQLVHLERTLKRTNSAVLIQKHVRGRIFRRVTASLMFLKHLMGGHTEEELNRAATAVPCVFKVAEEAQYAQGTPRASDGCLAAIAAASAALRLLLTLAATHSLPMHIAAGGNNRAAFEC